MLVYPPQTNSLTELRWRDRTGKQLGSLGAPGEYYTPRISPDGKRVAFTRRDGDNSEIWVANPDANSFTRLTFDPAIDEHPVWSPDGAAVTFANDASGHANLYRKAATGAGTIDRLTTKNSSNNSRSIGPAMGASCSIRSSLPARRSWFGRPRRTAAELPGPCARGF